MIGAKKIWKDIPSYNSMYKISNEGDVMSFVLSKSGKILKQNDVKGYRRVVLCNGDTQKQWAVHRLVALAFIENPENKPHINHKNGVRNDNRLENIEWCTISENAIHSFRVLGHTNPLKGKFGKDHPTHGKGVLVHPARRVKCDTLDMEFDTIGEAQRILGVNNISVVCSGKFKHTRGLTFRYL